MISKKQAGPRRRSPSRPTDEIATDDLIRELLDLFDCLGLDSGQLIRRVGNVNRANRSQIRNYPHASLIGDLLTVWNQDPKYLDRFGDPMPIRMKGKSRSFSELAQRCAPNINERQLLQELKQLGAVCVEKTD